MKLSERVERRILNSGSITLLQMDLPEIVSEIAKLEAVVEAAKIQQETADARQCPCRLNLKPALAALEDEDD